MMLVIKIKYETRRIFDNNFIKNKEFFIKKPTEMMNLFYNIFTNTRKICPSSCVIVPFSNSASSKIELEVLILLIRSSQ